MNNTRVSRRHFLTATAMAAAGLTVPRWLPHALAESGLSVDLGVCQSFEKSDLVKAGGFQYIEESVGHLLQPKATDEEFEKRLKLAQAASLPTRTCNGFIPGDLKFIGPDINLEPVLKFVETVCRRAKQAGVIRIVLGSGGARRIPEGFAHEKAVEQLVDFGRKVGALAQPHGVIVILEPLNKAECNFINRVDEGLAIVEAVGHPNFQLHADLYHMMREEEGPESILKAGAHLHHCHVAGKEHRMAPGLDKDDFRPYFKALKSIGYRDNISLECGWKNLASDLPEAYRIMREQLGSV